MARATFIPPGPRPLSYTLADPAAQTNPERIDSTLVVSVAKPERPGRVRRSLNMQRPTTPRKRDKAATRENASKAFEHAIRVARAYACDSEDARLIHLLTHYSKFLTGLEARNVAASLASGTINAKTRRALRLAVERASNV